MRLQHEPGNNDFEPDRAIGLKQAKPVGTPIAEVVLSADDHILLSPEDKSRFRTLAGALLWITRCTRPDIGFAVHQMTRRTHDPCMCDFKLGKKILRYLAGTSNYRLDAMKTVGGSDLHLEVYIDSDWASESSDRK